MRRFEDPDMPTLTFVGSHPVQVPFEGEITLLAAALQGGVPLPHRCGGHGRCGTCRVTLETAGAALLPPGESEQRTLRILREEGPRRLACQCQTSGDATCRVD